MTIVSRADGVLPTAVSWRRRWRSVVAVGAVAVATGATAGLAGQAGVAIPFAAQAGDRFAVTAVVEEQRLVAGAKESHVVRRARYDGRIEAVSAAGYRIGWTLKAFDTEVKHDATGHQPAVLAALRSANAAFMNKEIVFETDAAGAPMRIIGWDQLKPVFAAAMQTAIEDVITKAVMKRQPEAKPDVVAGIAAQQGRKLVEAVIVRHDDRTAVDLFHEATIVAAVQGTKLVPATPTVVTDKVTGSLTEGNIGRKTTFTLAERGGPAAPARITWSTTFDEAALREAAANSVRKQLREAMAAVTDAGLREEVTKKFEEQIKSIAVKRTDSGRGTVDAGTGWAREVVHDTRIETSQLGNPDDVREKTSTITIERIAR